ncbi:MAG: hypothetical protein ACRDBL_11240 [Rhabdaerophilum sp.]
MMDPRLKELLKPVPDSQIYTVKHTVDVPITREATVFATSLEDCNRQIDEDHCAWTITHVAGQPYALDRHIAIARRVEHLKADLAIDQARRCTFLVVWMWGVDLVMRLARAGWL